jgi:hypothetical protein
MDITEIIRARSFASSYTLEHLVGTGKIELKDWKEWADVLFAYLTQDTKDLKVTDERGKGYGGYSKTSAPTGTGAAPSMGASQWDLWKSLKDFGGGDIEESKRLLKLLTTFKGRDGKTFEGYNSVKATSDKVAKIATQSVKKLVEKGCTKKAASCDHSEWEADACYCRVLAGGKLCMFTSGDVAGVPNTPETPAEEGCFLRPF